MSHFVKNTPNFLWKFLDYAREIMFTLEYTHLSHHEELQIVQADVYLEVDGAVLIDEPLCIDVGLPALLLSAIQDVSPQRFAPPEQWESMPFFVCGCGDAECRACEFIVKHRGDDVQFIEAQQPYEGKINEYDTYVIPLDVYKDQIFKIGEQFLRFVEGRDYHPYFPETITTIKRLLEQIKKEC
jgi:hypothetical protein